MTTIVTLPKLPPASPPTPAEPPAKPADGAPAAAQAPAVAAPPPFPLAGSLRLNLTALGVDGCAPDFGEQLCQLTSDNHPYNFEFSAQGELIIMAPSGWESNIGEKGINAPLFYWCLAHGGFDASPTVMFHLPGGARYMPDAAWITQERYEALLAGEYMGTIDGAPDFVVEVRSRTDNPAEGLAKMREWMDGGARLGWYLDPYETRAYIYRPGQSVMILDNPETLSGEDVLPGFTFDVRRLIFARYPARANPNPPAPAPAPAPDHQQT